MLQLFWNVINLGFIFSDHIFHSRINIFQHLPVHYSTKYNTLSFSLEKSVKIGFYFRRSESREVLIPPPPCVGVLWDVIYCKSSLAVSMNLLKLVSTCFMFYAPQVISGFASYPPPSPRHPLMTSYSRIPWCSKYEGICEEYEEICQKYGGIWKNRSIYWIWHSHIYMGLGTWKNSEHRLHIMVSGIWKNSDFSPFIWALGLGKIPTSHFI